MGKEEEETGSLHDDLKASIDQLSTAGDSPDAPQPTPTAPATPTPAPTTSPEPAADETVPAKTAAVPATPLGSAEPALKAPQAWKPEMRERWASLPKEIQAEVLRREKEITAGLGSSAEARRFYEEFSRTIAPYQAHIGAVGGNPLKAFSDYLNTATLLRSGSPSEKANALASAIQEYGIDVAMLDSALAALLRGQAPASTPGQHQQVFRDPRVDQLLQEREQDLIATTKEEVTAFASDPKNEFFEDVRNEVADWLEYNASRGVKMTIQEAYNKAIAANDSVQATLAQRRAADLAKAQGGKVARARLAASSVGAGRAAPARVVPEHSGTLADDLRASIAALQEQ
jgi:hypothetical protein